MQNAVAQPVVSWEAALQAATEAVRHAMKIGVRVNVAVADSGGNLAAFLRMPGAFLHSIDIAIDKAYTSAGFGFPTAQWPAIFRDDADMRTAFPVRPRLVAIGGGLPIVEDGTCIGGIGVSGASAEQDEECARAGLQAIGLAH